MNREKQLTNQKQINNLLDNLDIPTLSLSSDLTITSCNKSAVKFFSESASRLIRANFNDLCSFHHLDCSTILKALNKLQCTESISHQTYYNDQLIELVVTHNSYSDLHHKYLVCIKHLHVPQENAFRTSVKYQSLQSKLEYLEKILACMPGNVYWMDTNFLTLGCNDNAAKLVGLKSGKDAIGMAYKDFAKLGNWTEKQAESFKKDNAEVIRTGKAKLNIEEPPLPHADGSVVYYLTNRVPIFDKNNNVIGVTGISIDITERKRIIAELKEAKTRAEKAEQEIKNILTLMNQEVTGESNINSANAEQLAQNIRNYLEYIIAKIPGNVYWMDTNCITLGCNDNTANLLGLKSRKEIAGMSFHDMAKLGNWTKKQEESFYKDSMEVIKTGKPKLNVEEPPLPHADGSIVYYLTNRAPIFNQNKKVIGLVGISFDITERKKTEQKLNEAKLKEKLLEEKLEAMNAIAASIAHELRTPLASISKGTSAEKYLPKLVEGYELAKQADLPVPFIRQNVIGPIKRLLHSIKNEAYFANQIINLLLANLNDLESSTNDTFALHSMSTCVNEAINRYPFGTQEERDKVQWQDDNDYTFKGEPMFIEHLIFNLLKNALYYIAKAHKGSIQIWLETNHEYNELHFKDTGTGIDPKILPKVFDRFFTRTVNGTGMGLAFCKMATEKMGGTITCTSEPGEFTEFAVKLPKPKE